MIQANRPSIQRSTDAAAGTTSRGACKAARTSRRKAAGPGPKADPGSQARARSQATCAVPASPLPPPPSVLAATSPGAQDQEAADDADKRSADPKQPVHEECPPRRETTAPRGTDHAAGEDMEMREQAAPDMLAEAGTVDQRREDLAAGGTLWEGAPGVVGRGAEREAAADPPAGGEAAKETVAPAGGEAAEETAAPAGGEAAEEIVAVLPADTADDYARDSAEAEEARGPWLTGCTAVWVCSRVKGSILSWTSPPRARLAVVALGQHRDGSEQRWHPPSPAPSTGGSGKSSRHNSKRLVRH
ncbi:unnamed protein product [Closterium sp. Yama58-4]|nr:unnamed protein product [Closterium sp. Yama58-4]